MSLTRRHFIALSGSLLATPGFAAQTDSFQPRQPVRIIVPFPPGGPIDQTARILSQKLSERWKQPVIVDNRTGASGIIAAEVTAKAPADGYTLLFSVFHHAVLPSIKSNLPYDIEKDFTPLSLAAVYPIVLVVSASSPIKSVTDLVAKAKTAPKTLTFGHSGRGGGAHLAGELFAMRAGIELVDVPYKGNGPAIVDVMGGQLDMMFSDIPTALPHMQSGRLRALAIATKERSALLPALPTVIEAGVPNYVAQTWGGLSVRADTPREISDRLHGDVIKVLTDPDTRARLTKIGAEPVPQTEAEYAAFIHSEMVKWAEVAHKANVRMD
ncbi:tripartite tricarboxylate transporter substrate binding protein [Variovorax sp. Sphag1AA]|uniref:Bug family tripartite tricarboxylate transporter substrate binding protein n=1 Tax=Variovorax sp. Sphag1AA TaxID=2587027 RepID=UPI00162023DD|nr:tripartite tricarboxylate transporter substrate binding protein [Variovorax sp. Sphag1AA]MBB3177974.1 tripartite-type tricarboxylate transporter receptor subunit TctC [Variovorax sp. Sphag1AA]